MSDESHLIPLNFENMGELDKGRLGVVLSRHIQTVVNDCVNRPVDASGKPAVRSVILQFDFTPKTQVGDFGEVNLSGTSCECTIKSKLPAHKSNPIQMLPGKNGFYFNPEFPEDPKQRSLLTGADEDGE